MASGNRMDRTNSIDGKTFKNPTFREFEPAIKILLNGTAKEIKTEETVDTFPILGDESTQRKIALETVESLFTSMFPGQTATDKKLKADILEKAFETRSWKEVEIMKLENLSIGLFYLQEFHKRYEATDKKEFLDGKDVSPKKIFALFDRVISETQITDNPFK